MKLTIDNNGWIDTSKPIDISMVLQNNEANARAWYVDSPKFEPVMENGFVGSVKEGGAVNFRNIFFNPHGHGTHTECLGHISKEWVNVNDCVKHFWHSCQLISVQPNTVYNEKYNETDEVVTLEQLQNSEIEPCEAVVIRTLPNEKSKINKHYSGTNPCYFDVKIVPFLNDLGVEHLLVDTPSVDRESDGGELIFHHAFWDYPSNPQYKKSITELVFVDSSIPDGRYMLNLQFASFNNDAAPSRPVLYAINDF